MAKARKSKSKKSKAKKSKAKKSTKKKARPAKRASAKSRRSPAKSRKPAARKPAKKAKKAASRKPKQTVGEGDYAASKTFLNDQADFVKRNKSKIPAMGKEAEQALDGPEGDSLRAAEQEAMNRSTIP